MKKMKVRFFLIFTAALFLAGCAGSATAPSAPVDDMAAAGGKAEKKQDKPGPRAALDVLVAAVPHGHTVALTGFRRLGGAADTLAAQVRGRLEPLVLAACRDRGLEVVDRENLDLVLNEWKLAQSGITGSDMGAAGLLGARVAITGAVAREGRQVHLFLKAVDLATGRVLATAGAFQPASLYSFDPAPRQTLPANMGVSADGRVTLAADAAAYSFGDHIRLSFSVREPGYVTVIDVNPEGKKTILFPNSYQTDNFCRPGRKYHIPPDDAAFDLEVTPPAGVDRVMALLSDSPGLAAAAATLPTAALTRGIVVRSRARAVIRVAIRRKPQERPPVGAASRPRTDRTTINHNP